MVLSLDFVRFYLHAHPDSSNLAVSSLKVFQQSRRELPEFGRHGGIVSLDEQCSRLQVRNPGCRGECRGRRFEKELLQVAQAAGATGKCLEPAGAGDDIADLLYRHRGVSGEGR